MKKNICPVCGSENALRVVSKSRKVHFAQEDGFANIKYYVCSNCGSQIALDYEPANEKSVKNALEEARNASVSKNLAKLEKEIPFASIERSFSLPPKTLSKWKNQSKKPSASAAAFVNILALFPWLAYVGFADYNPSESYKIESIAALQLWAQEPEVYPFFAKNENYMTLGVYKSNIKNYDDKPEPYLKSNQGESYVD